MSSSVAFSSISSTEITDIIPQEISCTRKGIDGTTHWILKETVGVVDEDSVTDLDLQVDVLVCSGFGSKMK